MFDNAHLYKSQRDYRLANAFYEHELQALTVRYELCYVPTRLGMTHVLLAGKEGAPTVIFWHGLNVNLTMWVEQINLIAPHFRVVAIDTIGNMGRSEAIRPDKHSNALGWWSSDVLDALGVESAHCVGISQGGFLVIKLATVAPQKIARALLFSCAGLARISWRLLASMVPIMFEPTRNPYRAWLKQMCAPNFEPTEHDIERFANMNHFRVEHRIPLLKRTEVQQLTAPTWVLMGEHDRTFDPQLVVHRAKTYLPKIERAEVIKGVSHGWEENKPLLNRYLQEFLGLQTQS